MATKKEETQEATVEIPEEAIQEAKEALDKRNAEAVESPGNDLADLSQPRVMRGKLPKMFPNKEMLVADYAPGLDYNEFGPTAFAAKASGPRTGSIRTQEFTLDPDKVRYLWFMEPGLNLPKKRLYTMKAFHRDGRLVQLPFELQIQNNAGGDLVDAIGLRRYQRKGLILLVHDPNTLMPIYCPAWGCFAMGKPELAGFCSARHAAHTLPNQYKEAGVNGLDVARGLFEAGATTQRVWSA